jgi:hypothetical protein
MRSYVPAPAVEEKDTMLRLLLVALVIGGAFVACEFVGAVLENRAQARHVVEENANPALAVTPPSLTPEARD